MKYEDLCSLVGIVNGNAPLDARTASEIRAFAQELESEQVTEPRQIADRAQHFGSTSLEGLRFALEIWARADSVTDEFVRRSAVAVLGSAHDVYGLVRSAIYFGMAENVRASREQNASDDGWPSADEAPPESNEDDEESGRPVCGDGLCVLGRSACEEEHPPVPIEQIPAWANALMRGGEQFEPAPWYVHAHHAAPVVVDGVASDAVTVFSCKTREECARMIGHCNSTSAFHAIDIHTHPPSLRPNLLRFCAKNAFNLK